MDGINNGTKQHVVVLAATNRPYVLDAALMRPGRFDRLVHVPLPDESARALIFSGQLARMRASTDLDVAVLASRTAGCSGAEVVMVCREASLLAIREVLEAPCDHRSLPCVRLEHFERALQEVSPRIDTATVQFYFDFERGQKGQK